MGDPKPVESEAVALERFEGPPPSTAHILALGVRLGADVAVLGTLMDLQERSEANEAKKLFTKAMAAFKSKCPAVLPKDGEVDFTSSKGRTHYKHATLPGIIQRITALLSENGLSVAWQTEQNNGGVTVSCRVTHEAGHSEAVTLSGPPDDSGNKNRIQQVGSTVTYLQRYTLLAALGLATAEQDDDGHGASQRPPITAEQVQAISEECKRLSIKKPDWNPDKLDLFPVGVKQMREFTEAEADGLLQRMKAATKKEDLKTSAPKRQADPLLAGKDSAEGGGEGRQAEQEESAAPADVFDREAAQNVIEDALQIEAVANAFDGLCEGIAVDPSDWTNTTDAKLKALAGKCADLKAAQE